MKDHKEKGAETGDKGGGNLEGPVRNTVRRVAKRTCAGTGIAKSGVQVEHKKDRNPGFGKGKQCYQTSVGKRKGVKVSRNERGGTLIATRKGDKTYSAWDKRS